MLLIHSARGVRLNHGCCGMSSVRFCASAEFHLSQPGQPSSSWRISRGLPLPPLTTTRSASSTRTVSSCHSAVPLPDAIAHFLSPRIEYHERVSLEKRILDATRLASGQARHRLRMSGLVWQGLPASLFEKRTQAGSLCME